MTATKVAKTKPGQLPAEMSAEMEADAIEHRQHFSRDMLVIPRISILQDLSPQVKERSVEFIAGAKPGMIHNNIAGSLDKIITFVPSAFFLRYIAWMPNRGGLVDPTLTREVVDENFTETGMGQWDGIMVPRGKKDSIRVEVIETPEWVGMAAGKNWGPMPVAISFPVTKAKAARKINTTIDLHREMNAVGVPYTPPAFYHNFELGSAIEGGADQEWFGWTVNRTGWAAPQMIKDAKELKIAFDEGKATVSEEGLES